jgi:methionine-rich copper-binding protein CopC
LKAKRFTLEIQMTRLFSKRSIAAFSAGVGLLLTAAQADAHAALVSATPAVNATVAAPKQVSLKFSEKLAPKFSGFDLMKADGSKVPVTTSVPAKNHKTLIGAVAGPLAPGTYMVMWHAVAADDGHKSKGDFNFTVH